ncbi:MAG: ribose-phosphate diphosphokinase [Patescibacteria group bacterium]
MELSLFANSSNQGLVKALLEELQDIPTFSSSGLADIELKFFADREPFVKIKENVRRSEGRICILIGCVASDAIGSVNDHAMELLVLLDAIKWADTEIDILLLPYLPYARQDRRTERTPITAALFARMLCMAGPWRRGACIEPHDSHLEMAFDRPFQRIPVIHVFTQPLRRMFTDLDKVVVASPDIGGRERASVLTGMLGSPNPVAIVDKRRTGPNEAKALKLDGNVKDLDVVLIDDMIDTAGTLCAAVEKLKEGGARRIAVCAPHGLLNRDAVQLIQDSPIERIFVTNTVEQKPASLASSKIEVISIAGILAEAIHRQLCSGSLSAMGKPRTRTA